MKLGVLMFGWEFPPHNSGGLGTACLGIVKSLAKSGNNVSFVLPKKISVENKDAQFIFADADSSGVAYLPVDSAISPYLTAEQYEKMKAEGKTFLYGTSLIDEVLIYGQKASKIAESAKFDVIHAHDWLSFPAGVSAKEKSGKPLVAHVHATEFDRTGGNSINEEVYKIEKEGMNKADSVVAVSNWTKNILIDKYDIPAEKITVVHNGIDITKEKKLPNPLDVLKRDGSGIVLFVGRITLQKGPDYFVQVAKKVLKHYSKVYFVVAGSGDMERRMMEDVAQSGIGDRVLFAGFARGEGLNQLYQSADIYVMPSVSEPFGLTPLEALSHQTPVLISKQSGVSEVLGHGLKSDFWDIDDMADKIIAVLSHKDLHQTLAENGHNEVQNITWDKATEKYLSVYNNLLRQSLKLS